MSARQGLHLAFGLPALAMPVLGWRLALIVALWALVLNHEFLPRTRFGQSLRKADEGRFGGIVVYPLTVALLIILFREWTLPIMAGWLVLAAADPMASLVGERRPWRALPWNSRKSVGGSLAFLLTASLVLVVTGRVSGHGLGPSLLFAGICAPVAAWLESLPLPLDDNLVVGLGTGAVAAGVSGVLFA